MKVEIETDVAESVSCPDVSLGPIATLANSVLDGPNPNVALTGCITHLPSVLRCCLDRRLQTAVLDSAN